MGCSHSVRQELIKHRKRHAQPPPTPPSFIPIQSKPPKSCKKIVLKAVTQSSTAETTKKPILLRQLPMKQRQMELKMQKQRRYRMNAYEGGGQEYCGYAGLVNRGGQ